MTRPPYDKPPRAGITWRLVVNSYPCPDCHVPPGLACITTTGRHKPEPHAARSTMAAARGWAHADAPARCTRCHALLAGSNPKPGRCARCTRREDGPPPTHATRDHPGPDGSYDVPLWGREP